MESTENAFPCEAVSEWTDKAMTSLGSNAGSGYSLITGRWVPVARKTMNKVQAKASDAMLKKLAITTLPLIKTQFLFSPIAYTNQKPTANMRLQAFEALFLHGFKDLYSAKNHFIKALTKMVKAVTSPE